MKIVLVTCGSRGDVQPMLALSLALQAKGHNVLLCGPPEKVAWANEMGCPFYPVGDDVTAFIDRMRNAHSLYPAMAFVRFVYRQIHLQFKRLFEVVQGADLVIGASLTFALASIAEIHEIAYRYIAFTPQLFRSKYHPCPVFKQQQLPQWCNAMTWSVVEFINRIGLNRIINQYRTHLGLKATPNAWHDILGARPLVASDSVLAAVPPDSEPMDCVQTGYLHLEQPAQRSIALDAFLSSGPAPIYAGFGSMPKQDQIRSMAMVMDAARHVGCRLVIAKFWPGPWAASDDPNVFFIQKFPHLELFPRMAAVLHHGGAGTTATTAISGVPQVIVPHILDQFYWADRVHRSGLGPKPVWRSRLTVTKLADAFQMVLTNAAMKQRSRAVSLSIRKTDGLDEAVTQLLSI